MRLLVRYAFMLNCICLIDWVQLNLNSPNLNSNECVGIVFKNGKPFLSYPLSCFGLAHLSSLFLFLLLQSTTGPNFLLPFLLFFLSRKAQNPATGPAPSFWPNPALLLPLSLPGGPRPSGASSTSSWTLAQARTPPARAPPRALRGPHAEALLPLLFVALRPPWTLRATAAVIRKTLAMLLPLELVELGPPPNHLFATVLRRPRVPPSFDVG